MTTGKVFTDWDATHSALWGHQPIRLAHELHKAPLFSMETLAELIERYPRQHYSLVQTGARGSGRVWREGEIGNLNGRQVMEAISRGGLWLNMRDVGAVDSRYRTLIDDMFAEVAARVPGFETCSPSREHPDLLARCAGLLPCRPAGAEPDPDRRTQTRLCLSEYAAVHYARHLEDIAVYNVEVDIPYESWYDQHAKVFDIGPGQMLSWELNAPHRVENLDTSASR